jgi:hypothetical protein
MIKHMMEYIAKHHRQIFDTGAAVVVFCNHCSSSSPAVAKQHLAWLSATRSDSRQQVTVLHQGMGRLLHLALELGRLDNLFAKIHREY